MYWQRADFVQGTPQARRQPPHNVPMPDSSDMLVNSSAVVRSPSASPIKQKPGSQQDLRTESQVASPGKQPVSPRRGSIWDSFFQYDITYQGGKKK